MKASIAVLAIVLLLAGPAVPAPAQEAFSPERIELMKKNITANLSHSAFGVRAGTLQLMIDLRQSHPEVSLDFAVIPVMRILKQDGHEGLRILAAVTLYHIGGERSRFAVSRRALYDASRRVARHCSRLRQYWDAPAPQQGAFAEALHGPVAGSPDAASSE